LSFEPIEWIEALHMTEQGAPCIWDVLDAVFANAQAVVVLQTLDDIAYFDSRLCEPGDPELENTRRRSAVFKESRRNGV
jgi:hypothetical protein